MTKVAIWYQLAVLVLLILQIKGSEQGMVIKTKLSGKERVIYEKGKTVNAFVPYREDLGTCSPVKRLIIGAGSSLFNFTVSGIMGFTNLRASIVGNSNSEVSDPFLSISQSSTTAEGSLSFNCKSLDYQNVNKPWTFIVIRVQDGSTKAEFELLKVCDEGFYRNFDWSVVILFVLVMVVVGLASRVKPKPARRGPPGPEEIENVIEEARTELKYWHVFIFAAMASIVLILAFLFTDTLLQIFTVGLCVSGITLFGFYTCQLLQYLLKGSPRVWRILLKKVLWDEITLAEIVSYVLSTALVISWLITKNWVLNNLIGVLYVACFLRIVRINSLIVSTVLLGILFFYDIFWVFYSDRVFGSNVMLTVATKFDLPIKLLMPHFKELPTSQCMLIGLGDLVVPGLVIAYSYRLSISFCTKWYYAMGITAYFVAILLCEIMLFVYEQAQPALLYISPALLAFMTLTSLIRKEFCKVWKGTVVKEKEDELVEKEKVNKQ